MTRTALIALAACVACDVPIIDIDLERMINQPRYQPYQASPFFADGRAMRSPPVDTVAHDRRTGDPALNTGLVDGGYVERSPMLLTPDVLARGRERYDIFCSPCHGIAGDGESLVAANMDLRKPPSLVDEEVRAFADGRIFQIISVGYGLMRPYSDDLAIEERWAVVGYLRSLQLRRGIPLDRLPLSLRRRALEELPR